MTAGEQAAEAAVVEGALAAAGEVVDVTALREVWATREAPPARWLVVGRRGAGKSRLVNRLTGADAAIGLGGVTTEVRACAGEGLVLTDTPGLEHELDGADLVEDALPSVDGLLWVVDGLQPLTSLERAVMRGAVPDAVPVVAVVSRLDLVDPAEHDAIFHRVRSLLAGRFLVAARPASELPALRRDLSRIHALQSPFRRATLRPPLLDLQAALGHLSDALGPAPGDLAHEAALDWRARVDDAHQTVAARVRDATLVFRDEALQALHTRLLSAADAVRKSLRTTLGAAPGWRPEPPDQLDLAGQAADLFGGTRHVLDGLAQGARTWSDAGAVAFELSVELPEGRALTMRQQAVTAAHHAVQAALADLAPFTPTPVAPPPSR